MVLRDASASKKKTWQELRKSQVNWKLKFKCHLRLSCLSNIICITCDCLFTRTGDLIHHNGPHSGPKPLCFFHLVIVIEILGPLNDISGLGQSWSFRLPLQIDEHSQEYTNNVFKILKSCQFSTK